MFPVVIGVNMLPNYFNFDFQITSSNMSIAITDISNLMIGDIVGVFFVDYDGYINVVDLLFLKEVQ